jgi:RHS repeat-associated protein
MVAEYSTIVEPTATAKISYLTTDYLGSPRINTDANGNVIARHDYLPFGEEIQSGTGERNSVQGYSGQDSIRQKFTGYERDAETDLDFAQARMYGFSHGRFMSVDPYNPFLGFFGYDFDNSNLRISQFISQPQYWNRYIYSVNNPLKFVDRDGEHPVAAIIVAVVIRAAVGATAGAAAGAAIEAGKQIYRDGKITDLNAIKSASLDGAIFGAFIGGAGPIGAAIGAPIRTAIVAGGVGSVTGGSVRRSMEGQETTTGDVITDAVAGGVGGGAGAVLGRLTAPKYKYPNGLNSNLQRRVSDETVYRTVNQTANKLFVPRSITNSLFDSQMGLRTKTYGSSFPATVARGITKSSIRSTNKPKKCPQGPNQCTEVTVTVLDDE